MGERTEASRFNRHSDALRARHGDRVWRIGLDGGFSCPNRRDGRGGCSYCAPGGARAPYQAKAGASLAAQVRAGMAFLGRRYGAQLFFPYFQAFSSTYAPVSVLKERYDEALAAAREILSRDDGFPRRGSDPSDLRGLVVSTRPDCMDEEVAGLLSSYADLGLEVWVELGLQSSRDRTLRDIGRGHDLATFERASRLLRGRGLRIAAHAILGLPGEDRGDMLGTVREIASLGLDGVKFHDLRILAGSRLAREYLAGEIVPLPPATLPGLLADCLEELPPACEVMRLCSDAPSASTLAPRRPPDKTELYRAVEAELASRNARQGSRFLGSR